MVTGWRGEWIKCPLPNPHFSSRASACSPCPQRSCTSRPSLNSVSVALNVTTEKVSVFWPPTVQCPGGAMQAWSRKDPASRLSGSWMSQGFEILRFH